jgi:hypothetical protein
VVKVLLRDALGLCGLIAILIGIDMFSRGAALIMGGVFAVAGAYLLARNG